MSGLLTQINKSDKLAALSVLVRERMSRLSYMKSPQNGLYKYPEGFVRLGTQKYATNYHKQLFPHEKNKIKRKRLQKRIILVYHHDYQGPKSRLSFL